MRTDDRTKEQKDSHTVLITATDKFMSGWGKARNGKSKCAWACKPEHVNQVLAWVESRNEMKYVNVNYTGKWYPKAAHVHIYVVNEDHPAIR